MRISDWSSDVCSSDLVPMFETMVAFLMVEHLYAKGFEPPLGPTGYARLNTPHRKQYRTKDGYGCILPYSDKPRAGRSEERRVGEGLDSKCRYRWSPYR